MSCGCNNNNGQCQPCGGECYTPQQPEKIRMTRNVNAKCCDDSVRGPRTCTRREWLCGIDCSQWCFSTQDCEVGVEQGGIAPLRAVYRDGTGNLVDPIEPRITIKDPYNNIYLSSQGMTKTEQGKYVFMFGTNGQTLIGVWTAVVTGVVGTIKVTDTYFFCVLPLGSIPFDTCPDGYGFDPYGDCYGYGYGGIQCGADGYGTFAGREECGFDGNRSKDIPSTGGCRTNRNPIGDGFWDGISYEDQCVIPIGKRGQCVKDKCVAMLRVRLKDIVPQCVVGDTVVTTQLGHKRIDNVKEGDLLWVYNSETKEYSYQPVREKLVNNTKTGEIVTIKTRRGRELRCTKQQPFIAIDNQQVNAENLEIGTKIPVNPLATTKMIDFDSEEIFFTYEQFVKHFPNIHEKTKEAVKKWFPIKGQAAVIFARLIGFIFGDGHLDKNLTQLTFASDHIEELQSIQKDLEYFNIISNDIQTRVGQVAAQSVSGYHKECSGVTTYFDLVNSGFAKMLALLGTPSGDKAIQNYLIPDWIFNNKWLLKNFLSAYYGADGCDVINSTGIREINFSFNKNRELNVTDFIDQWKIAFAQFGIFLRHREEPNSGAVRKDGIITTKWVLVPEQSEAEAIIKFAEQIGCCYHLGKAHNLAMVSEYFREVQVLRNEFENERQRVFDCLKNGLSRMEIVDEIHPNVTCKERAVLWNKYDRWIRGNQEAIECTIANIKKWNDAQQTIYQYVIEQSKSKTYGEIARDIIQKFLQEFNICGLTTKYKSVWALVKTWRNGRIPDSQRYDYCLEDKVWQTTQVGVDYKLNSFEEWQKEYVVENRYFDKVTEVEITQSNEDVYDCKFDVKYVFAESLLWVDCWAYSEDELDMQLETSLADFNAWPMFTCYTWDTVPQEFIGVIVLGAQVFSLFAQGLLESGREFTITDNGISFNPPQISGYMQTAASTLLQTYTEMKEKVKANLKPHPAGVGTFRVTSIMPQLSRLRHLRSKQII